MKYDAFISYRHCELDSFISENLHKKLESYKLPASVIKKIKAGRTKIERVFRDEAELPLSDNLSDPITEALNNSEFLIVICTPRLKESLWCRKEIETFVNTHDRKHVLLVLAEGEPEESFPDILMYEDITAKDENGNDLPKTVISREYSSEWKPGDEPYYPVNDEKNGKLYEEYKALAEKEEKVLFGGRLGEYKYYDMDAVIDSALNAADKELAR